MEISEQLQLHLKYIQNQRIQIENLRSQVQRLEQLWIMTCQDPQIKWLLENKSERMDPTLPVFDPGRADFHLDRYRFALERVAEKRVVDLACGTGYGTKLLRTEGHADFVAGVDICPEAIAYASEKHADAQVKYIVGDVGATCFDDGNFDVVVSFETLEHVEDDTGLIDEFHRVLKPGGMLICSTPNLWPLEIAPHHVKVYDRASFLTVLSRKFEVVELKNQNSGTPFEFNREQPRGIVPTTTENQHLAECFIAVAKRKD